MSVSVACFQVGVYATCYSFAQRSPTDCGASLCDLKSLVNEEALAHWRAVAPKEKKNLFSN